MSKIKITCDSTSDLNSELYEKYNIDVTPLSIILGNDVFKDGIDVMPADVFRFVSENSVLPKTSAVSVNEYIDFFKQFTDEGYTVIHINLSSELSSSFQNANIAAMELDAPIYPVDSKNLSVGSGILAIKAAEFAQTETDPQVIVEKLEEIKNKIDMSFVLQTLEFLRMGGRCSSVAAFGANALKIKPEIVVNDGTMAPHKKYRGDINKSVQSYIEGALKNRDDIDLKRIFVVHSCNDREIVINAINLVKSMYPFEEVLEATAGCTISSHCGPDTLGIAFIRE